MAEARIRVEVAVALPSGQSLLVLELSSGATAAEAIAAARVFETHRDFDASSCGLAVFGREVGGDYRLRDGDRVEVLRPLTHAPKSRRRQLARQGKSVGRKA